MVTDVDQDSAAYEAGLRPGDVIEEINHKPVQNAEDAVKLTENMKEKKILLKIWSNGGTQRPERKPFPRGGRKQGRLTLERSNAALPRRTMHLAGRAAFFCADDCFEYDTLKQLIYHRSDSDDMRILVVEDDAKIASFVVNGLKQSGFAVDRCADGEEGHLLASTTEYDAAVVDVMLPKLDGLTLVQNAAKGRRPRAGHHPERQGVGGRPHQRACRRAGTIT